MATWRQALEVGMTDEDVTRLMAVSRSRTEPASRVQRAQMLLAYRENPSFFAVGQRVGVHHQTVQRCIERALAYGPLMALDDRPRPGKEPNDYAGGKGLAGVAGVRQGQGPRLSPRVVDDASFGAPRARARGGGGTRMSRQSCPRHGVQDSRPGGNQTA